MSHKSIHLSKNHKHFTNCRVGFRLNIYFFIISIISVCFSITPPIGEKSILFFFCPQNPIFFTALNDANLILFLMPNTFFPFSNFWNVTGFLGGGRYMWWKRNVSMSNVTFKLSVTDGRKHLRFITQSVQELLNTLQNYENFRCHALISRLLKVFFFQALLFRESNRGRSMWPAENIYIVGLHAKFSISSHVIHTVEGEVCVMACEINLFRLEVHKCKFLLFPS